MRADYATSNLISKVNSEWIEQVLVNPESGRADAGDDVRGDHDLDGDLRLRREFARKRANLLRRDREPGIAVAPMARLSRRRSVTRRVTERLALAVVALTVIGVGIRMAPESRDLTGSAPERTTTASPEPAAPISTTELRPAWLAPEILYGPAMARSPLSPGR
jgi:hypothetical protein